MAADPIGRHESQAARRNGTPLASKILVVGMLLGILVAVVGSFIAPRGTQIWYMAAAVLIPAAFVMLGRLLEAFRRPR